MNLYIKTYLHQKQMFEGLLDNLKKGNSSSQNQGHPVLDLNLFDKAVGAILKFNVEEQSFNKRYPKIDHLQRYFNDLAVNHFLEIITKKYEKNPKPLSIVDIACGYGLPILILRQKLHQRGIQVQKIVGYDISEDMIKYDKIHNHFTEVEFRKANVQTQFKDIEEYDVAICLFGLHWMNNLESTIAAIHKSLKKGGIILSLTPIEIQDLFDFRTSFVNNSKWTSAFEQSAKTLHPFHFKKEDYLIPLQKYFTIVRNEKKETKFNYTRQQYLTFLQSWLQEVRHLTNQVSHELKKEAIARAYISDFIDSIEKNLNGNVIIKEDGSVIYTQHTLEFDGVKI